MSSLGSLTAKAKASVFSGRVTLDLCVSGWEVEFGVTGDVCSIGAVSEYLMTLLKQK